MRPIVLYLRVSTLDQDVTSQGEDLNRWAKSNDFEVVATFGEEISGYDPEVERKEYVKMKEYVLKNNIKDIAIWEISRLSRSMVTSVTEIKFFTQQKINIHFKKENLETISNNAANQLLINILSSMAEMERNTMMDRFNRGRDTAVRKGRMIGYSTPPYGYTSDENGIIKVEPSEAKVVEMIYGMALKGETLYGITQHLNSLNIPTRRKLQGKKGKYTEGEIVKYYEFIWKSTAVCRILRKTIYKGIRIYKGDNIAFPAIISEEIWNKIQKRFEDKVGYHSDTKYEYIFKSKMRCGNCGRMYATYKSKNVNYGYYLCSGGYDKILKCRFRNYINSIILDDILYNSIFNHKYINHIMSQVSSPVIEKHQKEGQIIYYNSEIEALELKKNRVKKLYMDGHITYEEFEKEISSLQNQNIEYLNKIRILQNEVNTLSKVDISKIIKTYKDSKDFNIKRDFVSKYVNDINIYKIDVANVNWKKTLHKDEKIIYIEMYAFNYNIPLKILLAPSSKNVIISNDLNYLKDFNMVVDIAKKTS
jgi:DNA invertase Pin-like site-specific DNA recombinase